MNKPTTFAAVLFALGAGMGIGRLLPPHLPVAAQAQARSRHLPEEQSIISVARKVSPAVVSVSRQGSLGSGVIVRGDGIVLTNAHVVGDATEVRVKLSDGKRLTGQVLGKDSSVDIAVVRIPGNGFPQAAMADSDRLEVGQFAIAIGNPLGLERTVTRGVVSAVNRRLGDAELAGLIQTDAAINPGNSGGPLLDSDGRVIGINTAVLKTEGASGLGFAVPINTANSVIRQVLATGKVRHVLLGLNISDLTPEMAERFHLSLSAGALVESVQPGSPAEHAGIREEDIVFQSGGTAINSAGDLRRLLRALQPGDTIPLTIRRGEHTVQTTAHLKAMP